MCSIKQYTVNNAHILKGKRLKGKNMFNYTLKNPGLKTTQLGLFGNPALGKYWTEHMLGYFDPAGWVKYFSHHAGVVLSHLLFKNYYIAV